MPDLVLHVPDDLLEWLSAAAGKHFRTPEGHVLALLTRSRILSESHERRTAPVSPDMQELTRELRLLWSTAGCPSSRVIARETAHGTVIVSHSTAHDAISGRRLVSWPRLEVIVTYLGGDVERFRSLWASAATVAGERAQ